MFRMFSIAVDNIQYWKDTIISKKERKRNRLWKALK